jgi:hypothetical protein
MAWSVVKVRHPQEPQTQTIMTALRHRPPAETVLATCSVGAGKTSWTAAFADEVWQLHHVIANPASRAAAVLTAKRRLLRRLRKIQPVAVSKESRRRSLRTDSFSENNRLAGITIIP